MVYQWKLPGLYPVDAQTAGEELERIYEDKGRLEPKEIVDESRPEEAPLHPCFEWDDPTAAELYRKHQAKQIIQSVVIPHETVNHEPVNVRAVVSIQGEYKPLTVVVNDDEQMNRLLADALAELKTFERKYSVLQQLAPIFDVIHSISA